MTSLPSSIYNGLGFVEVRVVSNLPSLGIVQDSGSRKSGRVERVNQMNCDASRSVEIDAIDLRRTASQDVAVDKINRGPKTPDSYLLRFVNSGYESA